MNIQSLLKQAQKMQVEIAKAEKALKERTYETTVGGGVVTIECNGACEVSKIDIDTTLLTVENKEMLEDMIQMAVNEVIGKALAEKEAVMNSLTGGVKLPGVM